MDGPSIPVARNGRTIDTPAAARMGYRIVRRPARRTGCEACGAVDRPGGGEERLRSVNGQRTEGSALTLYRDLAVTLNGADDDGGELRATRASALSGPRVTPPGRRRQG